MDQYSPSRSCSVHAPRAIDTRRSPGSRQKLRAACNSCHESKVKCSGGHPCSRCNSSGWSCEYSFSNRMGKPKGSRNRKTYERLQQQQTRGDTAASPSKEAPEAPTSSASSQGLHTGVPADSSTQLQHPFPEVDLPRLLSASSECASWYMDEIGPPDSDTWMSTDFFDMMGEAHTFNQDVYGEGNLLITPPEESVAAMPFGVDHPPPQAHPDTLLDNTQEYSIVSLPGSTFGSPSHCGSDSHSPSKVGATPATICTCAQNICQIELQTSLFQQRHRIITSDMLVLVVMPILTRSNKTLSCTACIAEPHIVHLNILILRRLLDWVEVFFSSQRQIIMEKGCGSSSSSSGGGRYLFSSRLRIGRHDIPGEEASLISSFLLSQIQSRYRTAIQTLQERLIKMQELLPPRMEQMQQLPSPEPDEMGMDMHYWHGMVQLLERKVCGTFEALEDEGRILCRRYGKS